MVRGNNHKNVSQNSCVKQSNSEQTARKTCCSYAGFSWQAHVAALQATQALVTKLQQPNSEHLSQDYTAVVEGLIPGALQHPSKACQSAGDCLEMKCHDVLFVAMGQQ